MMGAMGELDKVMQIWQYKPLSMITPTLRTINHDKCRLQLIEEEFDTVGDDIYKFPSRNLDSCVDWVTEKLKDWPDCHRMAWDMWDFKNQKDAEKFITVFHLSLVQ